MTFFFVYPYLHCSRKVALLLSVLLVGILFPRSVGVLMHVQATLYPSRDLFLEFVSVSFVRFTFSFDFLRPPFPLPHSLFFSFSFFLNPAFISLAFVLFLLASFCFHLQSPIAIRFPFMSSMLSITAIKNYLIEIVV